jgi:RNase P subunit RPR2
VGRRGIKEYRAPEALLLISADRDLQPLVCPTCQTTTIQRTPRRIGDPSIPSGRVTLSCGECGRTAVYIDRALSRDSLPEAPRPAV